MSAKTKKKQRINPVERIFRGQVLSLDFFKRNLLAVIALMAFIMVYITGKYICQTKMEEIGRLNKELEIVKAEKVRVRSLYMGRTSESAMKHLVDSVLPGLQVQEQPPFKLTY